MPNDLICIYKLKGGPCLHARLPGRTGRSSTMQEVVVTTTLGYHLPKNSGLNTYIFGNTLAPSPVDIPLYTKALFIEQWTL